MSFSLSLVLQFSYLLPIVCFLIFGRKQLKAITILMLVYSIAFFLLLFYYKEITKWVDQGLYSTIYTFLEYFLFTSFIFLNISNKVLRRVIIILSIGFIVFQSIYLLSNTINSLDTLPIGIETILLFLYVICFFYEQFRKSTNISIYNHYCFWISVGILVYLGGSFFFYILANHLTKAEADQYWKLTYIGEIIKNIFLSYSVFLFAKQKGENGFKNKILPNLDMV